MARRDGAHDAEPHERRAGLHPVGRLPQAVPDRSGGFREPGEGRRLGPPRSARVQNRQPLRVLEHRQHRDRAHGPEGHRQALRQAAAALRVPPPRAARDEPPGPRGPAPAVPARLRHGAGSAARGREHPAEPVGGVGLRRHRVHAARAEPLHRRPARVAPLPALAEADADAVRPGRGVEPSGPRRELRRPGAVPLPHPLRHRLRPYRQLPGLRAVRGRHARRAAAP